MLAHYCNPSIWKVETGQSGVLGQFLGQDPLLKRESYFVCIRYSTFGFEYNPEKFPSNGKYNIIIH